MRHLGMAGSFQASSDRDTLLRVAVHFPSGAETRNLLVGVSRIALGLEASWSHLLRQKNTHDCHHHSMHRFQVSPPLADFGDNTQL